MNPGRILACASEELDKGPLWSLFILNIILRIKRIDEIAVWAFAYCILCVLFLEKMSNWILVTPCAFFVGSLASSSKDVDLK